MTEPQMVAFLQEDMAPLEDLLTPRLLAELEPDGSDETHISFRTDFEAEYQSCRLEELPSVVDDEPHLELSNSRIGGDPSVRFGFSFSRSHSMWGEMAPILESSIGRGHLGHSASHVDRVTEFLAVLCEELPVVFLYMACDGSYWPEELPDRGNFAEQVMVDLSFINVLGPEVAAEFDRERLLSVPAYEVRELQDGGVLIRGFEVANDWDSGKTAPIRDHLGI